MPRDAGMIIESQRDKYAPSHNYNAPYVAVPIRTAICGMLGTHEDNLPPSLLSL